MAFGVGRRSRRGQGDEQLRRLLVRLSKKDREAFDAVALIVLRVRRGDGSVSRAWKKVYKS